MFIRYLYSSPEALPVVRDEDDAWVQVDLTQAEWLQIVKAAGFITYDDEVVVGSLDQPWNGHPSGSLVVTGPTVSGHPFAVQLNIRSY
jgi:hypothetical protein